VWERLVWVWGSEFVLCVGEFGAGLGELVFCRVWERFVWVWGSEFVLCVGEFGAGLGE